MVSIRNHVLLCLSLGLFLVLSNRQPARKIWAERAKVQNVQDVSGCLKQLCSKILWLHKGEQISFGDDIQRICDRYEAFLAGDHSQLKKDN